MTNEKHLEEVLYDLHMRGLIEVFNERTKHLDYRNGREKYFNEMFKIYRELISVHKS